LPSASDPREIETMKAQPGKDLIIFGSGSIVSGDVILRYARSTRVSP
jgi:hypothetical protein